MKFHERPAVKNTLLALGVTVCGFILSNVAFVLDALYQRLIDAVAGILVTANPEAIAPWYPRFKHFSFLAIMGLISWFVFKSKLKSFYKASIMVTVLAAAYATLGMIFWRWYGADYFAGGFLFIGVLSYLYFTKQPWIYYFSLALVSAVMLLITATGTSI